MGGGFTAPGQVAAFSDSTATPLTDQGAEYVAMAAYNSNPALQQYVQQEYGGDYGWMLAIPELKAILVAAASAGWDGGRISSALYSTTWWKQNGSTVAAWQDLQARDPQQAQAEINQNTNTVRDAAQKLGVQLSDQQIQNIASYNTEFQWTASTLNHVIATQYNATTNPTSGTAAAFQDSAQQAMQTYAVPMSQQAIQQWTSQAVLGNADAAGLNDYLRNQAKQLYPFMTKAIDQGVTPQAFLAPYSSAAATLLGVSEGSISWSDPKWLSAVTQPGPGGEQTPASLTQFQNTLRSDPTFGYSKTSGAVAAAYTTAKTIATSFGKVA